MSTGIYCIKNILSNKCYVGQSRCISKRLRQHFANAARGSTKCAALYAAIRAYGANTFAIEVLELCDLAELNTQEQLWVKQLETVAPYGYTFWKQAA